MDRLYYESVCNSTKTVEQLKERLLDVMTGIVYPSVCELGTFSEPEKMYVSYGRLLEMVDEGYNIIRIIDPNDARDSKIYIECQQCLEKKTKIR